MTDFWRLAWSVEGQLNSLAPSAPESREPLAALRDDLVLQQFLFVHRSWARPEWLGAFRASGLFEDPPSVERVDGGLRTRAWPVMQYLKAIATQSPVEVADVLVNLRSDNWWVISDGLEAAITLPAEQGVPPILNLLAEWQGAPTTWTHPETISRALTKLAEATLDPAQLGVATARVLDKLWRDTSQWYELEEVLNRLAEADAPVRYRVADGVELTLLGRRGVRRYKSASFAPRLDDLDPDVSDPVQLLARHWLALTEDEPKVVGPEATYARAARLMAVDDGLIRQMGLRALRVVLDERPHDRLAQQQLEEVATDPETLTNEAEIAELLPLFRAHFDRLSAETQVAVVENAYALATHEEKLSRYYGRDWLSAIEPFIGPRERLALRRVEEEVGPARSTFERHRAMAEFVPLRGPLADSDVRALAPGELLAFMRNVPRVGDDVFDSSVEAVAAQVKSEIARRLDDFIPLLPEIAENVSYPAIVHHVVWGLSEAFKNTDYQTQERLDALLSYLHAVTERASSGALEDDGHYGYGSRSVLRSVADIMEDHASWVLTTPDVQTVSAILDGLIASDDPTPQHEDQYGGSNMDPPTLALNTARGRATRALLRLLVDAAAPDSGAERFVPGLAELVRTRAQSETSPSVRSGFGVYLPWLVSRLPDLWAEIETDVLPTDSENRAWEAVFATYATFNNAHRAVAKSLQPHYELAAGRFTEDYPFLLAHADRVLTHLIALALPGSDSETWFQQLTSALGASPPSAVERAIRAFAHAARRDPQLVPRDWALQLVRGRLASISGRNERRPDEATGLLDLVLATGAAPVDAGGEVLGLMHAGATPRDWSVIEYLIDRDTPRTAIGVQILTLAIGDDDFRGFLRDAEGFAELLSDYAVAASEPTWRLVNQLGQMGIFLVEDLARSLAAGRP